MPHAGEASSVLEAVKTIAPSGGGGGGVTVHSALTGLAADDHGHYHTDARGDARYSPLGHGHSYEAPGAVSAHEAAFDPHPGYLTPAEGAASFAAIGHTHTGLPLAGTLAVTVPGPRGQFEHEETVAAAGITAGMLIFPAIAPHADTDENSEQALDVLAMAGEAGTGSITFRMAFGALTSGQIKINYLAL